ncbi:MAG: hypothetical protein ACXQS8_06820 [Candidatus Helarchaeales archaeon]
MTVYSDLKDDMAGFWGIATSEIPDSLLHRAVNWVRAEIDQLGFDLTIYTTNKWKSDYYQLYEAAFWFAAELLSQLGIINQNVGEISSEKLGRLEVRYGNKQPVFFFFGGKKKGLSIKDYERLLTHETYRTLAYSFIEMFYIDYMKGSIRRYPAEPRIATDSDWSTQWEQ